MKASWSSPPETGRAPDACSSSSTGTATAVSISKNSRPSRESSRCRNAARSATRYRLALDQLRDIIATTEKAAASYGRRWLWEFDLEIAAALAPQKDYATLAVDIATRLDKDLGSGDSAATRERVLKALAAARASAGTQASAEDSLQRRLVAAEESLDKEYRTRVPPFKPDAPGVRKAKTDRVAVLELFTGTQCPPCVAAGVAFDALRDTYRPTELVLIQYHLHIPGPDPLTNADGEARWASLKKAELAALNQELQQEKLARIDANRKFAEEPSSDDEDDEP